MIRGMQQHSCDPCRTLATLFAAQVTSGGASCSTCCACVPANIRVHAAFLVVCNACPTLSIRIAARCVQIPADFLNPIAEVLIRPPRSTTKLLRTWPAPDPAHFRSPSFHSRLHPIQLRLGQRQAIGEREDHGVACALHVIRPTPRHLSFGAALLALNCTRILKIASSLSSTRLQD